MWNDAASAAGMELQPGRAATLERFQRFQFWFIICAFVVILVRTAWVCDDAYITFRTVDNFLNGYGLRWNIDERVQSYTNPLWMLLMIPAHAITGEAYFSSLALCLVATLATLWLVCRRLAVTPVAMVLAASLLFFSKAFIDFSTSGLENPLSHLLMAGFLLVYLEAPPTPRRAGLLSLIAALATLTRPDHLLIYMPVLALQLFSTRRFRATLGLLAAGMLPLVAWEVFSVIYYGFPLPNTAYAKILVGDGMTHELLTQGTIYFLHSINTDPVTLLTIGAGLAATVILPMPRLRPMALGVALFLFYIWTIGGDFMGGRFFTTPLLVAVIILARLPWSWRGEWPVWLPLAILVLIGSNARYRPFATDSEFTFHETGVDSVVDERSYYFKNSGLINLSRYSYMPGNESAVAGHTFRRVVNKRGVLLLGTVGYEPYFTGPYLHCIDIYGLTDPIIARMPCFSSSFFRPGHIYRPVPRDYIASVKQQKNLIRDPKFAECYDAMRVITDGPIWTVQRWKDIYSWNFGRYRRWMSKYKPVYTLSDVQKIVPDGTRWDNVDNIVMGLEGIRIDMEGMRHNTELDISVDANDLYDLTFYRKKEKLWTYQVPRGQTGITNHHIIVDANCARRGYTEIRVRPIDELRDKRFALGHLILTAQE